jgi:regulator of protease activity HflC (stomatin/prohibitin superfamily)
MMVVIFEYETGIKYVGGKFHSLLSAGRYWYVPFFTHIVKVDLRQKFQTLSGQEVMSADGVPLKITLTANYEISDPVTAINKVESYANSLYLTLQLGLREIIGKLQIDEIMENRAGLGEKLLALNLPKAETLGIKLRLVECKDLMISGELKNAFAQVVKARKEGQAKLERARGETAALRNLANTAKMLDDNPNLMQLRLLEVLEGSSGNTVVFSATPLGIVPMRGAAGGKNGVPD